MPRYSLWNVFPLHPHEPNDPFTNRAHNARERSAGERILAALIVLLCPKRIVAVGNDAAEKAPPRVASDQQVIQVRHPSYGGQTAFSTDASQVDLFVQAAHTALIARTKWSRDHRK